MEYLIDFWGGRAVFDSNPVKAKITGYCWLLLDDAAAKLRSLCQAGIKGDFEIGIGLFRRTVKGQWQLVSGSFQIMNKY